MPEWRTLDRFARTHPRIGRWFQSAQTTHRRGGRAEALPGTAATHRLMQTTPPAALRRARAAGLVYCRAIHNSAAGHCRRGEIGRASCRERVEGEEVAG